MMTIIIPILRPAITHPHPLITAHRRVTATRHHRPPMAHPLTARRPVMRRHHLRADRCRCHRRRVMADRTQNAPNGAFCIGKMDNDRGEKI